MREKALTGWKGRRILPDLSFKVLSVRAESTALTPMLFFQLEASNKILDEEVNSVLLKSQINLEAPLRMYDDNEKLNLIEIFGSSEQFRKNLRSLVWTHASTIIPGFMDSVKFELPVSYTYDFEVASTKFFGALHEGVVPISFLFSGSIFYRDKEHGDIVQVNQIPWITEAAFELPIEAWHQAVDHSFPNTRWIRVQTETLKQLREYKARRGAPTLDDALRCLIEDELKSESAATLES